MNIVSREQVLVSLVNLMIFDIHVRSNENDPINEVFKIEIVPQPIAILCAATGITPDEVKAFAEDLLNKQLEITTDPLDRTNLQMIRDKALPNFVTYLNEVLNNNTFFFQVN